MNPALSVVFLTTLIGAGQGLFLALFAGELGSLPGVTRAGLVAGAAVSVLLSGLGLVASFFHLGHPERAWRAAAMWRTSWLSREVIVLPLFIAGTLAWGAMHAFGIGGTAWVGAVTTLLCLALFACTAMVYASVRFLAEWASPLTIVNYLLLGCASGTTLAAALPGPAGYAVAALVLTLAALATRAASLLRNARLKPRSTLQSAIGIKHPGIRQRAMGFTGASYNTREFFHGRAPGTLRAVKWFFVATAFVLPALLLLARSPGAAFAVQFAGLLAERWFFLAQANHPQNLYYQTVS